MKTENILLELSEYSELLKKPENIKIIKDYLEGYDLIYVRKDDDLVECTFSDTNMECLLLLIYEEKILIITPRNKQVNVVRIKKDNSTVETFITEKRLNGIIFSKILRTYGPAVTSKGKRTLTDIDEKRYVFTNDKLKKIVGVLKIEDISLLELNSHLISLFDTNESKMNIYADLCTTFSSGMHYLNHDKQTGKISINNCPTINTFFNQKDVSKTFNIITGSERIERINDLYHGIINQRNLYDIHSISLGLLPLEAFSFKEFIGVTQKENDLVGSPDYEIEENLKYIEGFLDNEYDCPFPFDEELTLSQNIRKVLSRKININKRNIN